MGVKIVCPKCGAEGFFSLRDPGYSGPYKCWKCREYYNLIIENDMIKSLQPFSPEQLKQQQEYEALKTKMRGGGQPPK
jgi:tRNA(Ile2) C34 agmatinyltransferase TiaS